MDSPKFRNYPCSSWMLMYGNTIEKPGNSSVEHTGLWERVWGRASNVNSCVVQLPVCAWCVQRQDWAAQGHYSSQSLYLKPIKATVAAGSHRTKLYTQPYSWGSSRRPEEPLLLPDWEETMPSHSHEVYCPCLVAFGPQEELSIQPGTVGRKAILGQGQDQEYAIL